ncbi:MAG TPA: ATP-binding protein [Ignavibacteria bacterium]
MITFDDIKIFSSLPIINTSTPEKVYDGIYCKTPTFCKNIFSRNDKCIEHYQKSIERKNEIIECPFGFSSFFVTYKEINYALTCFIPFPRQGSLQERQHAKKYPDNKYSRENITYLNSILHSVIDHLDTKEKEIFENYSKALHEIRKYNRTIKQISEVLLKNDNENQNLLRIFKASELMSKQHDIIEILASDSLLKLELKSNCEVYKIFDKIRKIVDSKNQIRIKAPTDYHPVVRACDMTFPIIANVLLNNALKYCVYGSEIDVEIIKHGENNNKCLIKVVNEIAMSMDLTDEVFKKGYRGTSTKEGSGYGLHVAQLVARQHNTEIKLIVEKIKNKKICTFRLILETI